MRGIRRALRRRIVGGIVRPLTRDAMVDQVRLLGAGSVRNVIDVGASVGHLTDAYAKAFPHSTVHAFEPLPDAAAHLTSRFADRPNVRIIASAVARTSGTVDFFATPVGNTSSLLTPSFGESTRLTVPSVSLDDYCEQAGIKVVDVLKVDVEGAEIDALTGATALLETARIRAILVEFRLVVETDGGALLPELLNLLRRYDYRLHNLYDMVESKAGGIIYGNALVIGPSMRSELLTRLGPEAFTQRSWR